ncbi:MAG: DoxX family protein [Chloroflexi bacterium]|nr:DoxX family protein [Chloroflexota bacterium]
MLRDLGLLALRLVVGGIFMAHGYPKLFGGAGKQVSPTVARYLGQGFVQAIERGGPENFKTTIERLQVPEPLAVAWFVGGLEFFGGALVALGWLTRPIAVLLAGEMAVVIARVHWPNGLMGAGGFELPLSLLGSCLALAGNGPGRLSIDGDPAP